jgi:Family of unknown function (DUF5990)
MPPEGASGPKAEPRKRATGDELTIRLVCRNLPGIRFNSVGRQRTSASRCTWEFRREPKLLKQSRQIGVRSTYNATVRVVKGRDGRPNFLRAYADGKPYDRFLYLSWVQLKPGRRFEMFRRAKIKLGHLTWDAVQKSIMTNKPLLAKLSLTDERGGPLCATLRDQHIKWRL